MKKIIFEDLKKYLSKTYDVKEENVNLDTKIFYNISSDNEENINNIYLSSLEYADLIVYMEEKYNVIYNFDEDINTIDELIQHILDHINDEEYKLVK